MRQPVIAIVRTLWLGLLATLLLLFAVLALPAYTAFMVIWMHVPPLQVLVITGPIAVLSLLIAVAVIRGARRTRKKVPQ